MHRVRIAPTGAPPVGDIAKDTNRGLQSIAKNKRLSRNGRCRNAKTISAVSNADGKTRNGGRDEKETD